MSATPKPAAVKDAAWHQAVPCLPMQDCQAVAAIVLSLASQFGILDATPGRAATPARAVIAVRAVVAVQDAIAVTDATPVTAATEEVATRRRIATGSFRPEIRRVCPPVGVGTAIVCHVNVEAILVADMAMV